MELDEYLEDMVDLIEVVHFDTDLKTQVRASQGEKMKFILENFFTEFFGRFIRKRPC